MKDIYELLNDVEIEADDFAEMEVSEFEKAKLKNRLKKSLPQKKKAMGWKRSAVAAAIIGLSFVTVGLAFPAYAANIPIVGDIFRFIDGGKTGVFDEYKENATNVGMSKEGQGIKVTLNDAIFDGKTVSITYEFESEQNLGDAQDLDKEPFVEPFLIIKGEQGWTGSSKLLKVDKHHYVGITSATTNQFEEKKEINVELLMPSIKIKDKNEVLNGNWNFNLDLKATKNNVQQVEQNSKQDGVNVEVSKITVTPMSFIVYYNSRIIFDSIKQKYPNVEVDLEIKDNLGNSYYGEIYGGWSDDEKNVQGYSKTFEKLDAKATKLIITPHLRLSKDVTKDGTFVGEETFLMEDIIVDMKK
ncbi:DUF4179 domain-containing protein [Metabacillus litoralis]|uniref:DUF4179 domain-containing protein n=1 Tax=Metabacillus litoralis TaxID=152268 RepID=UPI001CFC759F|nr:DUF4179 domain-containing protein [Metabacillus litoralis]